MRAPVSFFPGPHASASVLLALAAGALFFTGPTWPFWVLVALFVLDAVFDGVRTKLGGRR